MASITMSTTSLSMCTYIYKKKTINKGLERKLVLFCYYKLLILLWICVLCMSQSPGNLREEKRKDGTRRKLLISKETKQQSGTLMMRNEPDIEVQTFINIEIKVNEDWKHKKCKSITCSVKTNQQRGRKRVEDKNKNKL